MQLALYDARDAEEAGTGREAGTAREVERAREVRTTPTVSRVQPVQPVAPVQPVGHVQPLRSIQPTLCAACRAREARYGFRPAHEEDPTLERPRTLCFECFRMEMDRRRVVAAQLARGWNATQAKLPLPDRLETLARRRGRAQIAARHALNLR